MTDIARRMDVSGYDAKDVHLLGLAVAALGIAAATGATTALPLDPPIYHSLRRSLIRRGEITAATVPYWPANEW